MMIDHAASGFSRLDGKVAIVTGAGRGIGRETARILAHLGAVTIIAERSETGLETERLIREEGGEAWFIQTDVADEESVARLRRAVTAKCGRVDILVNNATLFSVGRLWEIPTADWDRVMAVNLRGAFLCIKAFLPGMLARRDGVVVTMESADGMPYIAPYLASKVGLRSLAASLAQEVGEESGVSVFCFGPGIVETPGLNEALEHLAPLYGMTRGQFIESLARQQVSVEASATGLVGAILQAREFHGQELGFAMGLGKLGLNGAGEPVAAERPPAAPAEPAVGLPSDALAANQRVEEILRAMLREYDELNLFQRPIVKRMFQQGTGLKVEEWVANAAAMSRRLESAGSQAPSETAPYMAQLRRLSQFILKQESDARGFFKNQADLDRALAALRERRAAVERASELLG